MGRDADRLMHVVIGGCRNSYFVAFFPPSPTLSNEIRKNQDLQIRSKEEILRA